MTPWTRRFAPTSKGIHGFESSWGLSASVVRILSTGGWLTFEPSTSTSASRVRVECVPPQIEVVAKGDTVGGGWLTFGPSSNTANGCIYQLALVTGQKASFQVLAKILLQHRICSKPRTLAFDTQ
jgi:hypothetical protein